MRQQEADFGPEQILEVGRRCRSVAVGDPHQASVYAGVDETLGGGAQCRRQGRGHVHDGHRVSRGEIRILVLLQLVESRTVPHSYHDRMEAG